MAHLLTVPVFWIACILLILGPFTHIRASALGLVLMLAVIAAQGRMHATESVRPEPFRSAFDFVARIFVEQWVTFPRYLLSGEFRKAWRRAAN